jgi:hypothetical protein
MTNRFRHAPPKAGAMLESLRGLGYSTAAALADIIDNSIAAHALNVEVTFVWSGRESRILVKDDGDGMDEAQLDLAMRLGEKSPLDPREADDLGRFGLGMKTASFSQCRRLTVASARNAVVHCLRWDLDVLAKSPGDGWRLLEGAAPGSDSYVAPLASMKGGTVVLWETLDRIVTPGSSEQDFLDLIDNVERHLAMVFHRYLSDRKLRLTINGQPVAPWDPFLAELTATWRSSVVELPFEGGIARVQCFVLPHKDRLNSETYDSAAGPDGWTAQQGFYVYRNERLLVPGGWLGLGQGRSWTREESHRLARIRLDIPNTADAAWEIDIRKSRAKPPVVLRARLTRLAEDARERARRVFARRGQPVTPSGHQVAQAWIAQRSLKGMRYRIDADHPAVRAVIEDAGPLHDQVRAMLSVIEETVPVQRIWLDTVEAKETPITGFGGATDAEVAAVLEPVYRHLVLRKGVAPQLARNRLLLTEPFNNFPDLVAALPDDPSQKK